MTVTGTSRVLHVTCAATYCDPGPVAVSVTARNARGTGPAATATLTYSGPTAAGAARRGRAAGLQRQHEWSGAAVEGIGTTTLNMTAPADWASFDGTCTWTHTGNQGGADSGTFACGAATVQIPINNGYIYDPNPGTVRALGGLPRHERPGLGRQRPVRLDHDPADPVRRLPAAVSRRRARSALTAGGPPVTALADTPTPTEADVAEFRQLHQRLGDAVEAALHGKRATVDLVLVVRLRRGPRAARGRPRHRQDHAGPGGGPGPGRPDAAGAVHPRPAAQRRHRHHRLRPARRPDPVPARARSSATCCWPTRSTAPRPRPSPRCWR